MRQQLKKKKMFHSVEKVEEEGELDWEEGDHSDSKAISNQHIQNLDEKQGAYIDSMKKRHLKSFEKEIMHNKITDIRRRRAKEKENPDRLHDICELKNMQTQREKRRRENSVLKENPELTELAETVQKIEEKQGQIA
mmetsp:Transcript_36643/g.56212  ORF Transcript_36643/g.56212 Transcript_36643/m.56212 type:complete len:137 (-) Transcript_36643:229-639(-)